MKYRHYSPRAELWLYPAGASSSQHLARDAERLAREGRRVAAIARGAVDAERCVRMPSDPSELARGLFKWLHELDALGVDAILVEGIAATGVGRAVMDRLSRAATRLRTPNDGAALAGDLPLAARQEARP